MLESGGLDARGRRPGVGLDRKRHGANVERRVESSRCVRGFFKSNEILFGASQVSELLIM